MLRQSNDSAYSLVVGSGSEFLEPTRDLYLHCEWLASMLDSLGDAFFVTNASGSIAYFNAVARQKLRSVFADAHPDRDTLSNGEFAEILRGINQQAATAAPSDALAGFVCREMHKLAERRGVAIDLSTFPILDADNHVVGAVILIRNARAAGARNAGNGMPAKRAERPRSIAAGA